MKPKITIPIILLVFFITFLIFISSCGTVIHEKEGNYININLPEDYSQNLKNISKNKSIFALSETSLILKVDVYTTGKLPILSQKYDLLFENNDDIIISFETPENKIYVSANLYYMNIDNDSMIAYASDEFILTSMSNNISLTLSWNEESYLLKPKVYFLVNEKEIPLTKTGIVNLNYNDFSFSDIFLEQDYYLEIYKGNFIDVYDTIFTSDSFVPYKFSKQDTYYFRIRGVNVIGPGDWSPWLSIVYDTLPNYPVLYNIQSPVQDGFYTLNWSFPYHEYYYHEYYYILEKSYVSDFSDVISSEKIYNYYFHYYHYYYTDFFKYNEYVTSDTTIFYRVCLVMHQDTTPWSNVISVEIDNPVTAPEIYSVQSYNKNNVYELKWTSLSNVQYFILEKSYDTSFNFIIGSYNINNLSFTETLNNEAVYYYRVKAVYFTGASSRWSNVVTLNYKELNNYTAVISDTQIIDMVAIPAGVYQMGSFTGEGYYNERPIHNATLNSFYIGKYEITNSQFRSVMQEDYWNEYYWNDYYYGDSYPVVGISWWDAIIFCNKLSIQQGLNPVYSYSDLGTNPEDWPSSLNHYSQRDTHNVNISFDTTANGYRLPTESEWEYATRAGTNTKYFWGDEIDTKYYWAQQYDTSYYWFGKVGSRLPNQWGLYDMSGNVSEWVWDWYDLYSFKPKINSIGPETGAFRVIRGALSSASRRFLLPNYRVSSTGFRIARSYYNYPYISHLKIENTIAGNDIKIKAVVTDVQIAEVNLYYRFSYISNYTMVKMTDDNYTFKATIPGNLVNSETVQYYIEAKDISNNYSYFGNSGLTTILPLTNPVSISVSTLGANYTAVLPVGINLDMIAVQGGTFLMGSPAGVGYDEERPQHLVTLSSFYIGKYEITQAQYQSIIETNPSNFSENGYNKPVERVSWWDAVIFCNKLSIQQSLTPVYTYSGFGTNPDDWALNLSDTAISMNRTANGYRLPTESEWEFAARGGNHSQGYIYSGSTIGFRIVRSF